MGNFIPGMSKLYAISRAQYYGQSYIFVSERMRGNFISVEEALADPPTGCPHQVFSRIVGEFKPFFVGLFENLNKSKKLKFCFVKNKPKVDSLFNEMNIKNSIVTDRSNRSYVSDV